MPNVSVIIPSYNHEKYIAETIQSVLDQTYQDFEIIITDDGSKDNTVKVIRQFDDPRIQLFTFSENQGACITANYCIAQSKGKFIALINSDDKWKPLKLEKQVEFLNNHPEIGAVFSRINLIDEDSKLFHKKHFYQNIFSAPNRSRYQWLNSFFYDGNSLCHPSILIRRECYQTVGKYDPRLAQLPDFEMWIRLCQQYEIYILPEALIEFRIRDHEANASGDRPEVHIRGSMEIQQVLNNYLSDEILDNIIEVFPDAKAIAKIPEDIEIDRTIAKYILAQLSLHHPVHHYRYFGITLLYDLLADNQIPKNLFEKLNFSYRDLIKLTGKIDSFNIKKVDYLEQQLRAFSGSKFWKIWQKWRQLADKFK